jgi:hypothetical protein
MRQAFAEYAGRLPVESGALRETLADVNAAMRAGGAVLALSTSTRTLADPTAA